MHDKKDCKIKLGSYRFLSFNSFLLSFSADQLRHIREYAWSFTFITKANFVKRAQLFEVRIENFRARKVCTLYSLSINLTWRYKNFVLNSFCIFKTSNPSLTLSISFLLCYIQDSSLKKKLLTIQITRILISSCLILVEAAFEVLLGQFFWRVF